MISKCQNEKSLDVDREILRTFIWHVAVRAIVVASVAVAALYYFLH